MLAKGHLINFKLEIERGQAEEVEGRERETEKVLK